MTSTASPILVLGGTGKTGRRVAARLADRGVPVRIGSRWATPAFDWEDRDTWAPALDGASAVYVSYFPDLALPGAAATVGAFAEQAVAAGVPRLVLLSGRGEEEAEKTEAQIRRSGAEWTILRATWFAQNFSETFMAEGVAAGELALPADGVREPFVDVEDIAEIAVAALTGPGHAGELYELTGPRLLTFADAVGEIAAVLGRPVGFTSVPLDAYAAVLREQGLPPVEVALITYLFGEVLDGRNEGLTDGVERALGRPPRDFGDYARETAAAGGWDA